MANATIETPGRRRAAERTGNEEKESSEGRQARHEEGQACQKGEAGQEGKARGRAQQQEGRGHRANEARQGGDPGRDRGADWLAEAYDPRLRFHPGQEGRAQDRILEERQGGAHVPHHEVAQLAGNRPSKRRSGHPAGAAFLLHVAAIARSK